MPKRLTKLLEEAEKEEEKVAEQEMLNRRVLARR